MPGDDVGLVGALSVIVLMVAADLRSLWSRSNVEARLVSRMRTFQPATATLLAAAATAYVVRFLKARLATGGADSHIPACDGDLIGGGGNGVRSANATILAAATAASIVFKLLSMGMQATVPIRIFQPAAATLLAAAAAAYFVRFKAICTLSTWNVLRVETVIMLAAIAAPMSAAALALAVALWAAPIFPVVFSSGGFFFFGRKKIFPTLLSRDIPV